MVIIIIKAGTIGNTANEACFVFVFARSFATRSFGAIIGSTISGYSCSSSGCTNPGG